METKEIKYSTINGMVSWSGKTEKHGFIGVMKGSVERLQEAMEKEFPSFRVSLVPK